MDSDLADRYLASELQRALTKRRDAILDGTAPSWENHISHFPEKIPVDLAKDFRRFRNIALGHVKIERSSLSLSDFYDQTFGVKCLDLIARPQPLGSSRKSAENIALLQ